MKRTVLILSLLTCFYKATFAQRSAASTDEQSSDSVSQPLVKIPAPNTEDDSSQAISNSDADFTIAQSAGGSSQTNRSKPRRKPAGESEMPTIQSVKVGYIDGAIIGSQVRIRVDAAFRDNASDRAEFFYAQYAGIKGPGPNFVIADLNFQQLYLNAEYAPKNNTRVSFFTDVPVRWIQPLDTKASGTSGTQSAKHAGNSAGLSDVAAGFKLAAVASSHQYLTFQAKAYFPSGNASMGLGTNHYSFEPALLYYLRFSDRVTLEAQVGDTHPIGGSSCLATPAMASPNLIPAGCIAPPTPPGSKSKDFASDVLFYGVGLSYLLYRGGTVQIAPVIEPVGWSVLGGLVTDNKTATQLFQEAVSASGINIVTVKVGARTSIGRHNSFYIGGGYAVTHSSWYKEIVRAEYRYSF